MAGVYVPRSPTTGVLYRVVRTPLTDFLASVDAVGFDLHAAVHVAAGDRVRLAQLCHYLCRPPLG